MKEMVRFLKPYRMGLVLSCLAIGLSTVCDLLLPAIMSRILNSGVAVKNFPYIVKCCAVMLCVSLAGLFSCIYGAQQSCRVVAGFCADLRGEVFRKVNGMTFEEFGKLGTAALVTRATQDVETVSWIASELAGTVITIPVLFFGGVILAMRKDVLLSLVLLAFVPVILAVVLVIGRRVVPLSELADQYIDKQNDIMRERLRGIRVIRAFNAEPGEHARIAGATKMMSKYIIKCNLSMELIAPLATFLLNSAAVLMVYFGAWRMENGSGLTGGDVFAIVQYVSLVTGGLLMGAYALIFFPQAKVSARRIGQVLHAEAMADPVARQALRLSGEIVFEHASFTYHGAAEPALRDITLHIEKGQKVAVIGGTGAGKSTLVALLLGFRMPTAGQVLLDGHPTTSLSRHTMRQNMSCVLQHTAVYSGSVRENVRMGCPDADDAAVMEALEIAQAGEFVRALPDGLDHAVKQSGKNLSGGQKQRIGIARAVLKDAPVYIFDDSFSALDFLTEANLRAALAKKLTGKTQIVITQRVTSAMHCDCIFVMDKGALVDAGTHEALLARCGVYQEIYASQTGGGRL